MASEIGNEKVKPTRRGRSTNSLILYDCNKPDTKFHTNVELLIIYHKHLQIVEVIARKFDSQGDLDKRIYIDYLKLYERIEHKLYAIYLLQVDQKQMEFDLGNNIASPRSPLKDTIPFNEYNFRINKEMVVTYVLERLNITLAANSDDFILLEMYENVFTATSVHKFESSTLLCEKPDDLTQFDITHHRQNSMWVKLKFWWHLLIFLLL